MATNQYNPNTGAKLKAGETVKVGNTNTYVTQGQTGTTTSAPKTSSSSGVGSSSSGGGGSSSSVGSNISSIPTTTIQKALGVTADGSYGANTTAAVKAFQQANGLTADGIVGAQTAAALQNAGKVTSTSSSSQPTSTNNTSTTTTTPTQTTPTSTTTKNNTSSYVVQSTLNTGSTGQDVKNIQGYLAGLGYKNADGTPLKVDGIYGANTKNAVLEFQSKNGLTPDGIVGNQTIDKINKAQTTNETVVAADETVVESVPDEVIKETPVDETPVPQVTANNKWGLTNQEWNSIPPMLQSMFNEMNGVINGVTAQGYVINPNLSIDETTAAKFLTLAKTKLHPVYQEQIDNVLAQANRDIEAQKNSYNYETGTSQNEYQKNLGNAREGWAGSGLAFSGQRQAGELGMQDEQAKALSNYEKLTGTKIGDIARGAEEKVGASNMGGFTLPDLATKTPTLEGYSGGYSPSGSLALDYKPGSFQYGTIPTNEESAVSTLANYNKELANKKLSQGLSYQDLLNA